MIFRLFYIMFISNSKNTIFIKYNDNKVCINCTNYMDRKQISQIYRNDIVSPGYGSVCKKFGIKDLITGEIEYEKTYHCRFDDDMCGREGKYFEQKNNTNK